MDLANGLFIRCYVDYTTNATRNVSIAISPKHGSQSQSTRHSSARKAFIGSPTPNSRSSVPSSSSMRAMWKQDSNTEKEC